MSDTETSDSPLPAENSSNETMSTRGGFFDRSDHGLLHEEDTAPDNEELHSLRHEDDNGNTMVKLARRTPMIVFAYVAIAALSNSLFGFEQSVISSAKVSFGQEFNISDTSVAYGFLASGNPIGATIGATGAGFIQGPIGRRFTLIFACVLYIGAVLVSYFSNGFGMLAWGRLQTGLAIGLFSSTGPMYIAELSPPHIRGKLVTLNQVCICLGILLGFVTDKVLTPHWRYMFISALPIAVLLLLSFIFITPFSPRWLMTKGREDEARRVLLRIRGAGGNNSDRKPDPIVTAEVEDELDGIRASIELTSSTSAWNVMKQPWVAKAVFVGVVLAFVQQWSGANAVNSYSAETFRNAGFDESDSLMMSIYIGIVKVVTVVIGLMMMDHFGRRALLLLGTVGMTISLACVGTSMSIAGSPPILSAIGLITYMAAFEFSLGPVMWLLLSELYPLAARGQAMAIGSTACWLFTCSVTFLYPTLTGWLGTSGTFFTFAAVCGLSLIWQYFWIPETKGKSLEQIEEMLKEGRLR